MKYKYFNASHATLSQVILERISKQRLIRTLNTTSDKAGSLIKFYPASGMAVADGAGATNQKVLPLASTVVNGSAITTNDYAIVATRTGLFMDSIGTVTAGESITLTNNLAKAVAEGDQVFIVRAADIGSLANGAASKNLELPFVGNADMPLCITLDSTSAGNFNGIAEAV